MPPAAAVADPPPAPGARTSAGRTPDPHGGEQIPCKWFPNGPHSVSRARDYVAGVLSAWLVDPDQIGDAVLMTSELVSNVYRHTRSTSAGVEVTATSRMVVVTVREELESDAPHSPQEPARMPSHDAKRGRGLAIVDALAHQWGVARSKQSTATWFSLLPNNPLPLSAVDPAAAQHLDELEAALRRSQLLLRITEQLAGADGIDEVAEVITRELKAHLGAMFVGIALLKPGGDRMGYVSLDPMPPDLPDREAWFDFPVNLDFPTAAAAAGNRPYFHASLAAVDAEFPGAREYLRLLDIEAVAHIPLVVSGQVIGVLGVAWSQSHEPDQDQRALLTIVAGYAAQALARR